MTDIKDLVLIYVEDQPLSFARIETIEPDVKPGWYQVTFLLLQIPLTVATWILREPYIEGEEFTMGGKKMRLEKVVAPKIPDLGPVKENESEVSRSKDGEKDERDDKQDKPEKSKVISLSDFKKQ